jgi:hypothetical protein
MRICQWRRWGVIALAANAFWCSGAAAQTDPDSMCEAARPPYGERTDWYDADGLIILDTVSKSSEAIVHRFAGAYTLLVITTEGSWEKVIAEYHLELAPPSTTEAAQISQIPAAAEGRLIVPLTATMRYRRSVTGRRKTAGPPRPDITGVTNFEYWPERGKLAFNVGLGIDSGTLFQVTEVEADGRFRGRWTDGGYVVIQLDTPVGPVLEHERGYFCAMPVGR